MSRQDINRSGEMEVFVSVVERGGFSAAAQARRMTPSAVSKLVARLETRLGARLVKIAPNSMRVEAPLSQWSEWSGLRFPVSGPYHLEGGLTPLIADCESGLGLYKEPNVWMRHRLEDDLKV